VGARVVVTCRRTGFTVIELLLVILIVGTMAGLSAPKFRGSYERLRLTESANSLRGAIRVARELAITEGVTHRVTLDVVDRSYWVERQSTDEMRYEKAQGRWGRAHRLANGIELAATPEVVGFGPDGRVAWLDVSRHEGATAISPPDHERYAPALAGRSGMEPEAFVTVLVLTNELGDSRSVLVDNITGRTWVEVGNRKEDGERANGTR
jgi:prepilin-type N-terminal cleavage/methylation domain-containing protein